MSWIPLSRGLWAIVDDADYEAVMAGGRWHAHVQVGSPVYAVRTMRRPGGGWMAHRMHQFLTGYPMTDHINGNGLDNRRANLRPATGSQNNANSRLYKNNTSGFKGVYWLRRRRRWCARIGIGGQQRYLGYFDTPEEAARAYDAAAVAAWGEYARPNFPRTEVTP